jgi:phosphate transport system substrate-binding protein
MSEPIPPTPKPFSTISYLCLTTFWVFLLPGAFFTGVPLLFLACVHLDLLSEVSFLFVLGAGSLAICVICHGWCLIFWMRFSANLLAGQVPKSFTLRILPFWIPLFWGLATVAVGFYTTPLSFEPFGSLDMIVAGAFPHYLILQFLPREFCITTSSIIIFLFAVGGTIYVAYIAPPVSKTRGLTLCTAITLLLCGLTGLSYSHFRMEILSPSYDGNKIMRDERIRKPYTDLSEYVPFRENNNLVKIYEPTLVIDSKHPNIGGVTALYPLYAAAVEATYRNTRQPYNSSGIRGCTNTSPEAFESLFGASEWRDHSDMIFMFQLSEKQLQMAKARGKELLITPIGYDAFVFFVNKVNPVDNLNLDQIRDIYSKKVTRWNSVGGKKRRILPFQRPEDSGSQTAMLRMMGEVPMAPPQREEFRYEWFWVISIADVADYRNYGNALGFSFRYYVESLYKNDGVKLLKVDGIAPTIENVQNGTYPLISELVIISRKDNTNPNVRRLTDWFLSPQGQELIKNVGYVPQE